jgi:hypothetical protein
MGNVYGIASPLPLAAVYGCVAGADVTLTAGTEVTFITTGAISAPGPGDWYPIIWGVLVDYLGATAPSALVIAFKIGAGSDVVTYTVDPGQLVNSAKIVVPFFLVGTNSGSAWIGGGSTINITANGTGQASTAKNVGSWAAVMLARGPDA